MGLRCSLTGHQFDETEVEREREQRGDEVVVITKEFDVCSRCSTRSLRSENKEVTSTGTESAGEPATPPEPEEESPSMLDAEPEEPEDAGIILEDDEPAEQTDESDETTEWPDREQPADSDEQPEAEPDSWPEHETDDEGIPATETRTENADVEYVGLTPTREGQHTESGEEDSTIERSAAAPTVDDAGRPTETMDLSCPACGFVDSGGHGSLRRGDICPECLDGYLAVEGEHNK